MQRIVRLINKDAEIIALYDSREIHVKTGTNFLPEAIARFIKHKHKGLVLEIPEKGDQRCPMCVQFLIEKSNEPAKKVVGATSQTLPSVNQPIVPPEQIDQKLADTAQ